MRRLIIILSFICFFILISSFFIKPVIMVLVKKQLENVFIQSQVSIKGYALDPKQRLSFLDIEIKRQGVYDIKVKEVVIQYNLFSVLKASSLKLSLKGSRVYLNTPNKRIGEFTSYLKVGQGRPFLGSVEVSDLALDLSTLDLIAKANLSLRLNLFTKALDYLDFKMNTFNMFDVQLENLSLKLGPEFSHGDFEISKIKYNKLSIADIKGKIKLEGMALLLYGLKARVLDGDIQGDLDLKIDKEMQYLVNLQCADLDIDRFVHDFELGEKFNMTGKLSGGLKLKGNRVEIEMLRGNFSTLSPGGTLTIQDTKFLENMARKTQQPIDLLVESFKNYHYNVGLINLGFEDGSIILNIGLVGETGKRNLNVILHDFKLLKEEQ